MHLKSEVKPIKEITVFTNGDSSKLSTWSNVPFFLTETLKAKGIVINRVDLSVRRILNKVYDKTFWRILKIINSKTTYWYMRTFIHYIDVRYRIRRAIKKYPNADANIFLTYSFSSAGLTHKPTILLCDWTYDYSFKNFKNRSPDLLEKSSIRREDNQIEGSDLVFSLFPRVTKYMKNKYKNKNIFYLGNIINSLFESKENEVIQRKMNSKALLFVGDKKYIDGANCLIESFRLLREGNPDFSLHIVGLKNNDFESLPEGVTCYGYLDKGKDADRDLYYSLFQNAKIFINTTPKWGAHSATIEAMYFYIPVIVTPYDEFVANFGDEITFGYYCNNISHLLVEKINKVLNDEMYGELCINAHNAVKEFTWSSYIDKMLVKINEWREGKL